MAKHTYQDLNRFIDSISDFQKHYPGMAFILASRINKFKFDNRQSLDKLSKGINKIFTEHVEFENDAFITEKDENGRAIDYKYKSDEDKRLFAEKMDALMKTPCKIIGQ